MEVKMEMGIPVYTEPSGPAFASRMTNISAMMNIITIDISCDLQGKHLINICPSRLPGLSKSNFTLPPDPFSPDVEG